MCPLDAKDILQVAGFGATYAALVFAMLVHPQAAISRVIMFFGAGAAVIFIGSSFGALLSLWEELFSLSERIQMEQAAGFGVHIGVALMALTVPLAAVYCTIVSPQPNVQKTLRRHVPVPPSQPLPLPVPPSQPLP